MPWTQVSGSYTPARGERVRLKVEFGYFVAMPSSADIRQILEAAGYMVVDVTTTYIGIIPRAPVIEVLAPGNQTMTEIGSGVTAALADSWRIFNVRVSEYQKYEVSIVPEPSVGQTVVVASIALIALVAVYFTRRYL